MNKLYSLLIALLAIGFVASVDARRCRSGRCGKTPACKKNVACPQPAPAACPAAEETVEVTQVMEPCRKLICVQGECPHEVRKVCKTTYSKQCVGPCVTDCDDKAYNAATE